MAGLEDLQLLPERRKKIEVHIPGENKLLIFSLIIFFVIAGIYAVAFFYERSVINSIFALDDQLKNLDVSRDKKAEENIILLANRLAVAAPLINTQNVWSKGFDKLQALTQPQVQFKTLGSRISDKKINIKAEAANYSTIARQIASFLSDDSITDVTLNKTQILTSGRIEFDMQINFNPEKFLNRVKPSAKSQ